MTIEILHHLSFRLPNRPELPASLATYIQLDNDLLMIRGDIQGAPTLEILDAFFEKGVRLSWPIWSLSFEGDAEHACAYSIEMSLAGDRRDVRLLNPREDLLDPTAPPMYAHLRSDRDAILSKQLQGPMTRLGNNLFVATSALQTLQLTPTSAVLVNGNRMGWHVVRPPSQSVLDPFLSFHGPDKRPYRAHQASIAKSGANLNFGVVTEAEGFGMNNCCNLFLMDLDSAARMMPPNRITLGDLKLEPVYPADSPEGQMVRAVTERMNRLIE